MLSVVMLNVVAPTHNDELKSNENYLSAVDAERERNREREGEREIERGREREKNIERGG